MVKKFVKTLPKKCADLLLTAPNPTVVNLISIYNNHFIA